jgi:hypothetical protein
LVFSMLVGKHAFSFKFPIITFLIILFCRFIFKRAFDAEPENERYKNKWPSLLYNIAIYSLSLIVWLGIIFFYFDKGFK